MADMEHTRHEGLKIGSVLLDTLAICLVGGLMILRALVARSEDQEHARSLLDEMGLIGFVANGSVLPRKSGVDDRPMTSKDDATLTALHRCEVIQARRDAVIDQCMKEANKNSSGKACWERSCP